MFKNRKRCWMGILFWMISSASGKFKWNEKPELNVPYLIESEGYPAEVHEVVTEDGYFLEVHRIPHGRRRIDSRRPQPEHEFQFSNGISDKNFRTEHTRSHLRRPPVLLVHCILCTSSIWVMQGSESGLGYMLADEGYDVWMLNTRGTSYSHKHLTLSSEDEEYWEFSFHEMGVYDVPKTIDYILEITNNTKLSYIGFSMGTTAFFIMGSTRPEYNSKIDKMIALAPATFITHAKGFVVNLAYSLDFIQDHMSFTRTWRIPADRWRARELLQLYCDYSNIFFRPICATLLEFLGNFSTKNLSMEKLKYYFKFFPDYSSARCSLHYLQNKKLERFCYFDYGDRKNMEKYGSRQPPSYRLDRVNSSVYIFFSEDDSITTKDDVFRLHNQLPDSYLHAIDIPKFSHADFCWGEGIRTIVNKHVMKVLENQLPVTTKTSRWF